MPVLYLGRNVNHISRVQFLSGFAPLLIITPTRRTKKDLTAVMVYISMPLARIFLRCRLRNGLLLDEFPTCSCLF